MSLQRLFVAGLKLQKLCSEAVFNVLMRKVLILREILRDSFLIKAGVHDPNAKGVLWHCCLEGALVVDLYVRGRCKHIVRSPGLSLKLANSIHTCAPLMTNSLTDDLS